jgi:pyruvate/2-oxoglutarate dehydrogenase complex dihydrolipoamide dehydrogenase (E3) component/uncharacterized membrane protein YdjX (TVP38/TMEM64 family)
MKPSSVIRRVAGVLLMGVIVATLIYLPVVVRDLYELLDAVRGMGPWAPLLLGAVYVLAVLIFVPGSVLTMGAGVIFGVVVGTISVSVASTLGAAAAFLLGRTLARGLIEKRVVRNARFQALDEAIRQQGFKIVLLLRLSPVFPFNLLNYALGLTKVSLRAYVFASWIGMLPGTVMYVYLGSTLKSLTDLTAGKSEGGVGEKLLFGVGLLATIAATVVITRLARKTLYEAVPTKKETEEVQQGERAMPETMQAADAVQVLPPDAYDQTLVANVHPPDWVNPIPAPRYNLVVIGAGTAGLVTAAGAAGLGARVALVEKHLMGGDCLNVSCVPSKALIRAARVVAQVRDAGQFGVRVPSGVSVDFPAVMERMRRLRAEISPHDSAARFRDLGVDVFLGDGKFTGPDTIAVAGQTLRFRRAVIATGSRPQSPPIPGLNEVGFLTNETVFSLTELPQRFGVIGAGPIGCELAQAFARFGSKVYLIEAAHGILPKQDPDAAEVVKQALLRDGITILCCGQDLRVNVETGAKRLQVDSHGKDYDLTVDEILVATGRRPNVGGLNLEAAGVRYDNRQGVLVNDWLQTSNRRIFAAGDICTPYQFTHMADAFARIVIRNALFFGRAKASALTVPWCTFTDPEVAHAGLSEREAKERGIEVQSLVQKLREVDRAVLDGEAEGFAKVLIKAGSDRILGATVVAAHAGEMISEVMLAMVGRLGLRTVAETIHPYPTQAEAFKKIADAYNRTRLTPLIKRLFQKWLAWAR